MPLVGGAVMDMENGNDLICWYFAGLMLMGALCWFGVRAIEGGKSMLELPSEVPTPGNMYTQFRPRIRGKLWLLSCIHTTWSR